MKCLLIKTQDNRNFFTHETNLHQLIDFAKTFSAEILVVESEEEFPILEIEELAPAFCNPNYKRNFPKYSVIATKMSYLINLPKRPTIRKVANQIQEHVLNTFTSGGVVSLKELKVQFATSKLSTACFCNHVRKAMKILAKQGLETKKVGAGKYQLINK